MAQLKDREEYEKWKAERQRQLAEKHNTGKESGQTEKPAEGSPVRQPSAPAPEELLPIEDLFSNAWEVYRQRVGPLIALYLFAAFSSLAVVALFGGAGFLLSFLLPAAKGPFIAADWGLPDMFLCP